MDPGHGKQYLEFHALLNLDADFVDLPESRLSQLGDSLLFCHVGNILDLHFILRVILVPFACQVSTAGSMGREGYTQTTLYIAMAQRIIIIIAWNWILA